MTSKNLRREILWGKEGRDKTYSGVCKLILFTILKSDTICIYEIQQRTRVKRAMQKTSDRICHPVWAFWILHSPPPTTKYDLQYQCLNELISYWEMKSQSIWESGFGFSWIGDHMIRLVACLLLEQVSLSFFLMSLLQYSTSSCCSSSMFVHGLHCDSL
jgi:hypothetical protein